MPSPRACSSRVEHRLRFGAPALQRPRHHPHLEIAFKFMPGGYKPEYRRARCARQRRRHRHQRWKPASSCTPTRCSRRTPSCSRSSRTCMRPASACVSRPSGDTTSRRSAASVRSQLGARLRLRRRRGAAAAQRHHPAHHRLHGQHALNKNIPDPRNWQGSGNRSVANMFIDLGNRVFLTDEQFPTEMAERREKLKLTRNNVVIGCPLCNILPGRPRRRRQQQ